MKDHIKYRKAFPDPDEEPQFTHAPFKKTMPTVVKLRGQPFIPDELDIPKEPFILSQAKDRMLGNLPPALEEIIDQPWESL